MNQDPEELKKILEKYSEKLAKLGMELGKNQFSYKVENKPSKEYWQKKIDDFKEYSEKGLEYYNQTYSFMDLLNTEKAQMFLLRTSKFRQLGATLIEIMEKIEKTPSIMNTKDRQQSLWSRKIKEDITNHSNKCLQHEKDMNILFRECYEKYLKQILK
ncbi:MAG: hypothetical protein ABGW49_00305 [Nitrosopumilus sp.]|nr:hypothetical protein [Nitrosopumilus sp.]